MSSNNNVNTGIFIVKNSEYSINFLKKWAYDEELYNENPYPYWWDQGVLVHMINQNMFNIRENSINIEYGILQHFFENDKSDNTYTFHLAGRKNDIRYTMSKNYFDKLKNEIGFIKD